jgi:hypothetical protein
MNLELSAQSHPKLGWLGTQLVSVVVGLTKLLEKAELEGNESGRIRRLMMNLLNIFRITRHLAHRL